MDGERIYYDGDCGVCHWAVKFVAARDREPWKFRFAPIGGETFRAAVPESVRLRLPDSLIVETDDGRLLTRSDGLIHILVRLGRLWPLVGRALGLLPKALRDFGYDLFARIRHRLVRRPEGACPILPPEMRRRFES